jgi:hypothetical protein
VFGLRMMRCVRPRAGGRPRGSANTSAKAASSSSRSLWCGRAWRCLAGGCVEAVQLDQLQRPRQTHGRREGFRRMDAHLVAERGSKPPV